MVAPAIILLQVPGVRAPGRRTQFDPKQRTGDTACPFTMLYWDFLARHRERFVNHPRMAMMVRNLDRIAEPELVQIRREASAFREAIAR